MNELIKSVYVFTFWYFSYGFLYDSPIGLALFPLLLFAGVTGAFVGSQIDDAVEKRDIENVIALEPGGSDAPKTPLLGDRLISIIPEGPRTVDNSISGKINRTLENTESLVKTGILAVGLFFIVKNRKALGKFING